MSNLSVFVNEQLAFEYDRSTRVDENQLAFLDKIDADMDKGVKIPGELITDRDSKQKTTFVALNRLRALKQEDDTRIAVYCSYLNSQLPYAVEMHARDQDARINTEFVEEH
jgi:hypothetical protein